MSFIKNIEFSKVHHLSSLINFSQGRVNIVIGENPQITLKAGETVVMPADIPHALSAPEQFKMLLILVKP